MPRNTLGCPQPTKEDKERQRRWQAEDDFRTLGCAAEIQADEDRKKAVLEIFKESGEMIKKLFDKQSEPNKDSKNKSVDTSKKTSVVHATERKRY